MSEAVMTAKGVRGSGRMHLVVACDHLMQEADVVSSRGDVMAGIDAMVRQIAAFMVARVDVCSCKVNPPQGWRLMSDDEAFGVRSQ